MLWVLAKHVLIAMRRVAPARPCYHGLTRHDANWKP